MEILSAGRPRWERPSKSWVHQNAVNNSRERGVNLPWFCRRRMTAASRLLPVTKGCNRPMADVVLGPISTYSCQPHLPHLPQGHTCRTVWIIPLMRMPISSAQPWPCVFSIAGIKGNGSQLITDPFQGSHRRSVTVCIDLIADLVFAVQLPKPGSASLRPSCPAQ